MTRRSILDSVYGCAVTACDAIEARDAGHCDHAHVALLVGDLGLRVLPVPRVVYGRSSRRFYILTPRPEKPWRKR